MAETNGERARVDEEREEIANLVKFHFSLRKDRD